MNRLKHLAAALCAALLLSAAGARAAPTLVFTNMGLNRTFDQTHWDYVEGQGSYLATAFQTPGFEIFLDHIDLPLFNGSPCTSFSLSKGVSVDLVADAGGKPRLPVISHWIITQPRFFCGTLRATKLEIPATQSVALSANTIYWVVVTPIGFDNVTAWFKGLTDDGASVFSNDGGQSWSPATAILSHFVPGHMGPFALDVWRR